MNLNLISISLIYLFAGLLHFIKPKIYLPMMPPYLPFPRALIFLSGIAEIVMGLLVLLPHTRNLAAIGIALMLLVFFAVHIYMWQERNGKFKNIPKLILIIRFPLQLLLIAWALSFVSWDILLQRDPQVISFKTTNSLAGKEQTISGRLYRAEGKGKLPVVVVVHGGSWQGTAGDMENLSQQLAAAGFAVFNIDYRFAPESLYPKAVQDVKDAVAWLRGHADEANINSGQIAGWGYSAGAHLILMAGLDPSLQLKAIVAGGTPADLTAWPDSPIVTTFLGTSFESNPSLWTEASPINHVQQESPPVYLYHGEWDSFVETYQLDRMESALIKKQRPVETYRVPYLGHIGTYFFGQSAIDRGIDFLRQRLIEGR